MKPKNNGSLKVILNQISFLGRIFENDKAGIFTPCVENRPFLLPLAKDDKSMRFRILKTSHS